MEWSSPDAWDIIDCYRDIMDQVQHFADQQIALSEQADLQNTFLDNLPTQKIYDLLQRIFYQRIYTMFFNDWLLLDYRPGRKFPTLAEAALAELKDKLTGLEQEALRNLCASYIAPYRVLSYTDGCGRLENVINPQTTYEFITNFSDLVVGDVIATRLLKISKSSWLLQEPWLIIIPREEKHLVKSLHRTLKETGYSRNDALDFCKRQASQLLAALNDEIIKMEKDSADMIEEVGFHPVWMEAVIEDHEHWAVILDQNPTLVRPFDDIDQFVFINKEGTLHLTWAYLELTDDRLCVGIPPREDQENITNILIPAENEALPEPEFVKINPAEEKYRALNQHMVDGIAHLAGQNNDLIDVFLIPRKKPGQSHIEQSRADFFANLSVQLGKRM